MKKLFLVFFLFPLWSNAQPNGYYNTALGLNGQALQTALHNIIKAHNSLGYSGLWAAFQQTDQKNNGKVWDIYSDQPGGTPSYQYNFSSDQCGSYNSEGDCYNREHSFPQSYFNSNEPMKSDLFIVYPTDGYVNGKRSDYPYGIVNNPSYTSSNGSKLGNNNYPGSPSGTAFEPIDSFKGDLARTYFYIATRYLNEDNGWEDWEMANGAVLKPWAISMLLEWHHNDPVSAKELSRNNAVYGLQQNRNPYIDYPQFADCIWGNGNCAAMSVPQFVQERAVEIYPNPATTEFTVDLSQLAPDEVLALDVMNLQGQNIRHISQPQEHTTIITQSMQRGVYYIQIRTLKNRVIKKLVVE